METRYSALSRDEQIKIVERHGLQFWRDNIHTIDFASDSGGVMTFGQNQLGWIAAHLEELERASVAT